MEFAWKMCEGGAKRQVEGEVKLAMGRAFDCVRDDHDGGCADDGGRAASSNLLKDRDDG